jgi:protein-tyrosine phosphatase
MISIKRSKWPPKQRLRCIICTFGGLIECRRCGNNAYLQQKSPAIAKLHSSWITDNILAMQRPSDKLFADGLIDEFLNNNIMSVFNLTEPGEHPYCGNLNCSKTKFASVVPITTYNLMNSGFPYDPEKLMVHGIKHFNFNWPDMTVPSMTMILDIVEIAINELNSGHKIAIHCHAGYGRTGIAIACILIKLQGITSDDVIRMIRSQRPGSIQTKQQVKFIYDFEKNIRS